MAIDLRDVPKEKQTYEMCLKSVKVDGRQLEYVDKVHQTDGLCLEAVKQYGGP